MINIYLSKTLDGTVKIVLMDEKLFDVSNGLVIVNHLPKGNKTKKQRTLIGRITLLFL